MKTIKRLGKTLFISESAETVVTDTQVYVKLKIGQRDALLLMDREGWEALNSGQDITYTPYIE